MKPLHAISPLHVVAFSFFILVVNSFFSPTGSEIESSVVFKGTSKVSVEPDVARFVFSFREETQDISSAKVVIDRKVEATHKFLLSSDVDKKDIKTIGFNISPRYSNTTRNVGKLIQRESVIVGSTVSHTTEVIVRDFDKVGDILSYLTEQGVGSIGDLNFEVDEDKMESYQNQLYADAILNARENAKSVASKSGLRLGDIISISEANSPKFFAPRAPAKALLNFGGASSDAIEVFRGEKDIQKEVFVTYSL